jgi:hypothetical protein
VNIGVNVPNGVPANATALVINLTGADSTGPTYITAKPFGDQSISSVSSLNLAANETRANLVAVGIGMISGSRGFWLNAGPSAVDAIVDLEGYYAPGSRSPTNTATRGIR